MLRQSPAWLLLQRHHEEMRDVHMRDLFARDPQRFGKFSLSLGDLLVDFSKHRVTDQTLHLLFALARQQLVEEWRDRMFRGQKVNTTQARARRHGPLPN